jgi:riboflavin transporter FmnP
VAPLNRSRRISLVALFTTLALVLNLLVSVPAPYAGFLFYEVWEIPILLSVLLLGFWSGVTVAALNSIVLEGLKPGPLPSGPVYNFIAEVSMFVGVVLVLSVGRRRGWSPAGAVGAATAVGIATRTAVMTIVNAIVLPLPYPIGFGPFVTAAQVPWYLVLIGIFNATTALYTVPLAYSVSRAVMARYGRAFGNLTSAEPVS